jgi:hypothetical protein
VIPAEVLPPLRFLPGRSGGYLSQVGPTGPTEGEIMAKKSTLTPEDQVALSFYLEVTVRELVSMVADHGRSCMVRQDAERLMALAGWTEEDLGRAFVEAVSW